MKLRKEKKIENLISNENDEKNKEIILRIV